MFKGSHGYPDNPIRMNKEYTSFCHDLSYILQVRGVGSLDVPIPRVLEPENESCHH